MGRESLGPIPLDMPEVPFIPPEKDREWNPVPLEVPLPPTEPPDDENPSKKPDEGNQPTQKDEMGEGVIVNRTNKTDDEDKRSWSPMKPDDEM